jgi:hypothetical protein
MSSIQSVQKTFRASVKRVSASGDAGIDKYHENGRSGRREKSKSSSSTSIATRLALNLANFDKIPIEELYNLPTLPDAYLNKLSRSELSALRTFKMPVTASQIRQSFEREFPGRMLQKTPFHLFPASYFASYYLANSTGIIRQPIIMRSSVLMAKRLVLQRLFHRNLKRMKQEHDKALNLESVMPYEDIQDLVQPIESPSFLKSTEKHAALKSTTDDLWQDIQTKNYKKYTGKGLLSIIFDGKVQESHNNITPECEKALEYASVALGKNATMGYHLKVDALKVIYNVFTFGKKKL